MASEETVLKFIGYFLVGAAVIFAAAYILMAFRPPSEAWSSPQTRLFILASVIGMSALIAWLGLSLLFRRSPHD